MADPVNYRALAEELAQILPRFGAGPGPKKVDRILHGEMMLLGYLATHENVRPSDLMAFSDTSSAHVAQTLRSLEAKGEVVRAMDPHDRRRTLVLLTDTGRARVEEAWEGAMQHIQESLMFLGEGDARSLVRIMERLSVWMQGHMGSLSK